MARDTEERVIAYSLLIVAGVSAVGWFAWLVTSARPAGMLTLVLLGSMVMTMLSVPASVIAIVVYDRSDRDWTTASRLVALALVVGVFASTIYLFVWGPETALLLAGTAVALVSVWVLVPLGIGAIRAATGDVSMFGVLLAWPPSALLAMAILVAPAPGGIDFATGNATDLAEPLRSLTLLCVVAVATFGPAVLGRLMDRLITVRVERTPT